MASLNELHARDDMVIGIENHLRKSGFNRRGYSSPVAAIYALLALKPEISSQYAFPIIVRCGFSIRQTRTAVKALGLSMKWGDVWKASQLK